jgi:hypothetical protein
MKCILLALGVSHVLVIGLEGNFVHKTNYDELTLTHRHPEENPHVIGSFNSIICLEGFLAKDFNYRHIWMFSNKNIGEIGLCSHWYKRLFVVIKSRRDNFGRTSNSLVNTLFLFFIRPFYQYNVINTHKYT